MGIIVQNKVAHWSTAYICCLLVSCNVKNLHHFTAQTQMLLIY